MSEDANKEKFINNAPHYQIIHLATHACIDNENPMLNRVWFSDDYISNYDLINMQLSADLAVLSACNTGSGKLAKGEGVQSLARGFMQAGTPSLVTSLWSVDDCATSKIMIDFYKYLHQGLAKDKALQKANIDYISSANKLRAHPYYWGAFVQIGDYEPLKLYGGNFLSNYWWLLTGLFIAILIIVFKTRSGISE